MHMINLRWWALGGAHHAHDQLTLVGHGLTAQVGGQAVPLGIPKANSYWAQVCIRIGTCDALKYVK